MYLLVTCSRFGRALACALCRMLLRRELSYQPARHSGAVRDKCSWMYDMLYQDGARNKHAASPPSIK